MSKDITTLKSQSGIKQGHSKLYHFDTLEHLLVLDSLCPYDAPFLR